MFIPQSDGPNPFEPCATLAERLLIGDLLCGRELLTLCLQAAKIERQPLQRAARELRRSRSVDRFSRHQAEAAAVSWSRQFDAPIPLPDGGELRTVRDAGEYIAALPKQDQDQPHWKTAARELMMAADKGGIVMLAEIAMRQALNAGKPPPEPRRKPAKKYRIVR
jgi:hypothetical protein